MESVAKVRKNELDTLNNFINNSFKKINDILHTLNWDKEHLCNKQAGEEITDCPLDPEHRVPSNKLSKHMERCVWKKEGYSDQDVPLPEITEQSQSTVVIDKTLQATILKEATRSSPCEVGTVISDDRCVPQTADRITSDFTTEEKLALYNYAVSKTVPPSIMKTEELNLFYKKDEETRPKTKLELLMEMRDAKRRRISYRSKKVHTNRKSHIEILREVIQNQMEFLQDLSGQGIAEQETEREISQEDDQKRIPNAFDQGLDKHNPVKCENIVESKGEICSLKDQKSSQGNTHSRYKTYDPSNTSNEWRSKHEQKQHRIESVGSYKCGYDSNRNDFHKYEGEKYNKQYKRERQQSRSIDTDQTYYRRAKRSEDPKTDISRMGKHSNYKANQQDDERYSFSSTSVRSQGGTKHRYRKEEYSEDRMEERRDSNHEIDNRDFRLNSKKRHRQRNRSSSESNGTVHNKEMIPKMYLSSYSKEEQHEKYLKTEGSLKMKKHKKHKHKKKKKKSKNHSDKSSSYSSESNVD